MSGVAQDLTKTTITIRANSEISLDLADSPPPILKHGGANTDATAARPIFLLASALTMSFKNPTRYARESQ
jgi:hypothetical protein